MTDPKLMYTLDNEDNLVYVRTIGAAVTNSAGKTLAGVEENAQVNVIESITYNSSALTISSKSVALPVFTMSKLGTATSGYAASYQLTKDGVAVGDTIDIPKDMVVQSGEVKTCTQADTPVEGYVVGDKYIDLVIANKSDSHLYILVSDLIDTYTAGTGINIANNVISVNLSAAEIPNLTSAKITLMTGYTATTEGAVADVAATDSLNEAIAKLQYNVNKKLDANTAITGATKCKITYDNDGLVTAGADLSAEDIPNLTSAKVTLLTGYTATTEGASVAVAATDTLNEAIAKLQYSINKLGAGNFLRYAEVIE